MTSPHTILARFTVHAATKDAAQEHLAGALDYLNEVSNDDSAIGDYSLSAAPRLPHPAGAQFIGFATLGAAQQHRQQHGGWIFVPDSRRAGPVWYPRTCAASQIFELARKAGQTGRVI